MSSPNHNHNPEDPKHMHPNNQNHMSPFTFTNLEIQTCRLDRFCEFLVAKANVAPIPPGSVMVNPLQTPGPARRLADPNIRRTYRYLSALFPQLPRCVAPGRFLQELALSDISALVIKWDSRSDDEGPVYDYKLRDFVMRVHDIRRGAFPELKHGHVASLALQDQWQAVYHLMTSHR